MGAGQSNSVSATSVEDVKARFFAKAASVESEDFSKDVLTAMNALVRAKKAEITSTLPVDSNGFAALVTARVAAEEVFNKQMDDIGRRMRGKIAELENISAEVQGMRVKIREAPFSEAQREAAQAAQLDLESYVESRVTRIQSDYARRMSDLRETLFSALQSLEKMRK